MFGKKRYSLEEMGVEVDQDPVLSNTVVEEEAAEPVVVEEASTPEDKDSRIAELEAQVAELQAQANGTGEATVVETPETPSSDDLSTEGFLGGLGGFFLGTATTVVGIAPIIGAVAGAEVDKKRKELEHLTKKLKEVALTDGKKAVEEGKLDVEDFKKIQKADGSAIAWGFFGGFFGGIYGAIKGHQLEELLDEIKTKESELQEILDRARAQAKK